MASAKRDILGDQAIMFSSLRSWPFTKNLFKPFVDLQVLHGGRCGNRSSEGRTSILVSVPLAVVWGPRGFSVHLAVLIHVDVTFLATQRQPFFGRRGFVEYALGALCHCREAELLRMWISPTRTTVPDPNTLIRKTLFSSRKLNRWNQLPNLLELGGGR